MSKRPCWKPFLAGDPGGGECWWCGERLRNGGMGDYGDGFFCGLRCGYQFGRMKAQVEREQDEKDAEMAAGDDDK